MELEELKTSWSVLNERLEKSEMLNKRIIKEMIAGRTQSAYERLFKFDMFGLLWVIGFSILLPIMYFVGGAGMKLVGGVEMKPLAFALLEGVLIIGAISQIFIVFILTRFDMEKRKICELTKLTLRYRLWTKMSLLYGSVLGIVAVFAFLFIERDRLAGNWEMRLVALLLIASVMTCYQINFYRKNIQTIEKGLEELKEFEGNQ